MSTQKATSNTGISFASLLGLAFIILRLTNVIDWSWWWVLAPFWIPVALLIVVLLTVGLVAMVKGRS